MWIALLMCDSQKYIVIDKPLINLIHRLNTNAKNQLLQYQAIPKLQHFKDIL